MSEALDAVDAKILDLIQHDAGLSVAEIAERVGLSSSPCWRRIKRLEDTGVIQRRVTILDRDLLGLGFEVYCTVKLSLPTRDNLHDYFNGLMWLQFPRAKRRLNLLQAGELARLGGVGAQRGPLRDALTLFDENVALFRGPEVLWQALAHKRWQELFVQERALWAACDILLFGHALLEQLVQPFKSITAHVYRVPEQLPAVGSPDWQAAWDDWLAQDLGESALVPKPYVHLPVLGVPGWWQDNADADFYDDVTVFRPLRRPPPAKFTN